MFNLPSCMCTGRCRKPPYTCSGKTEPDFLTDAQRLEHNRAYMRGETNFRTPFEPWAVRSWSRYLDSINGFKRTDEVRSNITDAIKIANDPCLTTNQKISRIRKKK